MCSYYYFHILRNRYFKIKALSSCLNEVNLCDFLPYKKATQQKPYRLRRCRIGDPDSILPMIQKFRIFQLLNLSSQNASSALRLRVIIWISKFAKQSTKQVFSKAGVKRKGTPRPLRLRADSLFSTLKLDHLPTQFCILSRFYQNIYVLTKLRNCKTPSNSVVVRPTYI